ncbi:hypothetical protein [Agrobacterium pusense]|uniref:hypothetical protein n=1 Tax=Agrobacterium pusense TaxID=648995 RepID=UPI002FDEE443
MIRPLLKPLHWTARSVTLAVLLMVNWFFYREAVDISPLEPGPLTEATTKGQATTAQSQFGGDIKISHTLARPLFSQTRREFVAETPRTTSKPVEEVVAMKPIDQALRPQFSFQGTRLFGSRASVLVALDPLQPAIWLSAGDQLQGWVVEEVGRDTLILANGEQKATYALFAAADKTPETGKDKGVPNGQ